MECCIHIWYSSIYIGNSPYPFVGLHIYIHHCVYVRSATNVYGYSLYIQRTYTLLHMIWNLPLVQSLCIQCDIWVLLYEVDSAHVHLFVWPPTCGRRLLLMATGNGTPTIQALSSALAVAIAQHVGGANNQSSSASFPLHKRLLLRNRRVEVPRVALVGTLPNWAYELTFIFL